MLVCPPALTHESLPRFLRVLHLASELQFEQIDLDCSALRFVDPMGLCLLHHWFHDLQDKGRQVRLNNLPLQIESFLARMDLFQGIECVQYDNRTGGYQRNDLTGHAIEVTTVRDAESIDVAAARVAAAVVFGIPDIDRTPDPDGMVAPPAEQFTELLEYVFSEILANTMQHGRRRGWNHAHATVAAQYYPSRGKLAVAILDNGCGLLETLQTHSAMEGDRSHEKAIEIALRPRVSSNRDGELGLDMRNQGIGLTVSTRIALASQGQFGVFSGTGWRKANSNGPTVSKAIPFWQGTGVYLEFDRSTMGLVHKHVIVRELPGFQEVGALTFG
ncbi:STAS domain-containing protein [Ralstonia wenshanensis]|uniref:STAS domain-containing protein n=1 Tax=Ralstonia wenshanensis TaxID=2842456 RepID=UPI0039C66839